MHSQQTVNCEDMTVKVIHITFRYHYAFLPSPAFVSTPSLTIEHTKQIASTNTIWCLNFASICLNHHLESNRHRIALFNSKLKVRFYVASAQLQRSLFSAPGAIKSFHYFLFAIIFIADITNWQKSYGQRWHEGGGDRKLGLWQCMQRRCSVEIGHPMDGGQCGRTAGIDLLHSWTWEIDKGKLPSYANIAFFQYCLFSFHPVRLWILHEFDFQISQFCFRSFAVGHSMSFVARSQMDSWRIGIHHIVVCPRNSGRSEK